MNRVLKNIGFWGLLLVSARASADQWSFQLNLLDSFAGFSTYSPLDGLQPVPGEKEGFKLEADYLFGEKHGIFLGAAFESEENEYVDCRTSTYPCTRFTSRIAYPSLAIGYYWILKNARIWPSLNLGYGTFKFQDQYGSHVYKNETLVADVGFKSSYVIQTESLNFPIIYGIGLLNIFPGDFEYNGADFPGDEFRQIYLTLGLGIDL